MQRITITGNLGRDAEVRETKTGATVCEFSVGASRKAKDGSDVTTWYRCSMWGRRGENLAPFLTKGRKVCVVGELRLSETESNGRTFRNNDVDADCVEFFGGQAQQPQYGSASDPRPAEPQPAYGGADVYDEDIPF